MTHTEGPWKVTVLDGDTFINPDREFGEYALIARVLPPALHNAPLLAAAPQLLEALRWALAGIDPINRGDNWQRAHDLVERLT